MLSPDLAPSYVRAIAPYQPGKPISELAREMGLKESDIVKLASNENPLGMGDKAKAAMVAAAKDISRYPDGNGFELKQAIAKKFNVALESIVLGNGSNDVLELATQAFLTPSSSAVFSQHAFAVYPLATQARGATCLAAAPAKDFGHDLDAMLAAIRPDTRLVFIANPNNPTGTFLEGSALERFLAVVPENIIVILDQAYNEYLPPEKHIDNIALLARFPNLMITRTFSKAYGLAGLRVGYGLADPTVVDMINRVRQPFNVNSMALAAATAALGDEAFVAKSHALNQAGMKQITDAVTAMGLAYIPSFANFVSIRIPHTAEVYQSLLKRGVIVRPIANYGMPDYLRVSIGLPDENAKFIAALKASLAALPVAA